MSDESTATKVSQVSVRQPSGGTLSDEARTKGTVPAGKRPLVFLSWSGPRSHAVADGLKTLLESLGWDTFLSAKNINIGEYWAVALAEQLARSTSGVLCITKENRASDWMMFEAGRLAGALAKRQEMASTAVFPYLIGPDNDTASLVGPLAQIQGGVADLEHHRDLAGRANHDPDMTAARSTTWRLIESICEKHQLDSGEYTAEFDERWDAFSAILRDQIGLGGETFDRGSGPYVGTFANVFRDVVAYLDQTNFQGEAFLYNLELNTLDAPGAWTPLLSNPGVTAFRFALSAHVYERLEDKLNSEAVRKVFSAAKDRTWFHPIAVPPRLATHTFAYFKSSSKEPKDVCFRLWKAEPDAEVFTKKQIPEVSYRYYLRIDNSRGGPEADIIGALHAQFLRDTYQSPEMTIADIERHNEGRGKTPARALEDHRFPSDQRASYLQDLVEYPTQIVKAPPKRPPSRYVAAGEPANNRKRVLLWAPPWGLSRWHNEMRRINQRLSKTHDIYTVEYAQPSSKYSFSSAERDIAQTLDQVSKGGTRDVTLAGVSFNAFLSAIVASGAPAVKQVVLCSSAIDLFSSIDVFRTEECELFTRAVYALKDHWLASNYVKNNELKYFGASVGPHHLVDLSVRGRLTSSYQYLKDAIRKIVGGGREVIFLHSKEDQMTPYCGVEELVEELGSDSGIRIVDYAWRHDLANGQFWHPTVASEAAKIVDALSVHGNAREDEAAG